MTEGFPNPYIEDREASSGELAQEYAALFKMISLFFDLEFTELEKNAIPVVIGAFMRERKKIDLVKLVETLKGFLPNPTPSV